MLALIVICFCGGCDHALKTRVTNWIPQTTGGPIEIRPLPPAERVHADFQQWLDSETSVKVRLYEATLECETNQSSYTRKVGKGETPLGATFYTSVKFKYQDYTNGLYQYEWICRGKQNDDLLRVNAKPKKVLIQWVDTVEESSIPRLNVVAIEGVEPQGILVAEPGRKSIQRGHP